MDAEKSLGGDAIHTPQTDLISRECPHCREFHEVQVITEPEWERVVYCPRTGVAG